MFNSNMYNASWKIEVDEFDGYEELELGFNLCRNTTLWESYLEDEYFEYDKYYTNYTIEILTNFDEEQIKIGEVNITDFDLFSINSDDVDLFDLFDSIDDEYMKVGDALVNCEVLKSIINFDTNLLYLEKIIINKSFRNHGIGLRIIKKLEEIIPNLLNYRPDILLLCSYPIEYQAENKETMLKNNKVEEYNLEFKKLSDKLNSFYIKCGLKEIEYDDDTFYYSIWNKFNY